MVLVISARVFSKHLERNALCPQPAANEPCVDAPVVGPFWTVLPVTEQIWDGIVLFRVDPKPEPSMNDPEDPIG